MAYLSAEQAVSTFLYDNWTDTQVCYPNGTEPDLGGKTHWVRVYVFQSTSETTLSSDNRVTDQGLIYFDVVGERGTGTGTHTELCQKLAKLFQAQYINGVSMQNAAITPVQGYDAEGRFVKRVTCEYVCDYEY